MGTTVKEDSRIRVGDFVKVKVPRFVARVGYPKSLEDYERELNEDPAKQELISTLFVALTGHDQVWRGQGDRKHRSRYRVEREIAYLMAVRDNFGGQERSIHWVEHPEHQDAECTVEDLRTACTGNYYAPSGFGGGGMFDDNDGYEPGGLSEMKHHRLARVNLYAPSAPLIFGANDHRTLELPVTHLQKLRDSRNREAKHGDRITFRGDTWYVVCRVPAAQSLPEVAVGIGIISEGDGHRDQLLGRLVGAELEPVRFDRYLVTKGGSMPDLGRPRQSLLGYRFYTVPVRGSKVAR